MISATLWVPAGVPGNAPIWIIPIIGLGFENIAVRAMIAPARVVFFALRMRLYCVSFSVRFSIEQTAGPDNSIKGRARANRHSSSQAGEMMISLIKHPKRRVGLIIAALVSVLVHVALIFIIRAAPVFQLA